jgi:DNA-binding NarL/FixJ family response regulator
MAQGKNNAAIAASLVITEHSVEKLIHSIFTKLGLTWQSDINRRVKAVLLYLADRDERAL